MERNTLSNPAKERHVRTKKVCQRTPRGYLVDTPSNQSDESDRMDTREHQWRAKQAYQGPQGSGSAKRALYPQTVLSRRVLEASISKY